jgi:beta-1,2-mannobiose phosphorylase / 1,2-beta-oligomannan phosphorylase
MIQIKKEGILLSKTSLGFENEGVLNPAVMQDGNTIHLFYRAVRKGNYSSIGYCKLEGPLTVVERADAPVLFPQYAYESQGIEDPRIVKINGQYLMTYAGYDEINALGALAVSKDLKTFEKAGLIAPEISFAEFRRLAESGNRMNEKYFRYNERDNITKKNHKHVLLWDKNLVFFPRKINNKLVFLHRIRPDIQLVSVENLSDLTKEFWENYFLHFHDHIIMEPIFSHEISYIGAGCPPIETEYGWLLIYHGVHDTSSGYVYSACAALLDRENPSIEIARLPYALFTPEHEWELKGEVNNVVFPTGTSLFGDTLYIYYGAADERIACASVTLSGLLEELLKNKSSHE